MRGKQVSQSCCLLFSDADHALFVLQGYHEKLTDREDADLRTAIENIMDTLNNDLFGALIGKVESNISEYIFTHYCKIRQPFFCSLLKHLHSDALMVFLFY